MDNKPTKKQVAAAAFRQGHAEYRATTPGADDLPKIQWTPAMLRRMRGAYQVAVGREAEEFKFDGKVYHTGYAKYLIQFLEMQFGVSGSDPAAN